uniref:Uncharacterized protein n=1 Tax=Arundo donax TaxID=35708 RepID=A0A0A9AAU8_ARUDO
MLQTALAAGAVLSYFKALCTRPCDIPLQAKDS